MADGLKKYLLYIIIWLIFMAIIGFLAWLTPKLAKIFYKKTGQTPKYTTYEEPSPDENGKDAS